MDKKRIRAEPGLELYHKTRLGYKEFHISLTILQCVEFREYEIKICNMPDKICMHVLYLSVIWIFKVKFDFNCLLTTILVLR